MRSIDKLSYLRGVAGERTRVCLGMGVAEGLQDMMLMDRSYRRLMKGCNDLRALMLPWQGVQGVVIYPFSEAICNCNQEAGRAGLRR